MAQDDWDFSTLPRLSGKPLTDEEEKKRGWAGPIERQQYPLAPTVTEEPPRRYAPWEQRPEEDEDWVWQPFSLTEDESRETFDFSTLPKIQPPEFGTMPPREPQSLRERLFGVPPPTRRTTDIELPAEDPEVKREREQRAVEEAQQQREAQERMERATREAAAAERIRQLGGREDPYAATPSVPTIPVPSARQPMRDVPHTESFTVPGSVKVTEPPPRTGQEPLPKPWDTTQPRLGRPGGRPRMFVDEPTFQHDIELRPEPKRGPEETPPETVAPTRNMSSEGIRLLQQREGGFYGEPYSDGKKPAIGYGFNTYKGEPVTWDLRITQEEGDAEFDRLLTTKYQKTINDALEVPVTQNQYDSLLSFAWNTPEGALSIVKKLNRGDDIVLEDFLKWHYSEGKPHPGLLNRRRDEYAQFQKPDDRIVGQTAATPEPPPPPPRESRGLLEPGNIDLYAQPKLNNADGTVSTVDSRSYNIDGVEVVLPSVTPDGRHLQTDEQIVDEYRRTGRHLGKFADVASAKQHAEQLHRDYEFGKYDRRPWQESISLSPLRAAPKTGPSISRESGGPAIRARAPSPPSLRDYINDATAIAGRGTIGATEAIVGGVDLLSTPARLMAERAVGHPLPTPGEVLEGFGYDPEAGRALMDAYLSDQQYRANKSVEEAEGLLDKAIAALQSPRWIVQQLGEAYPAMVAGGLVGKVSGAAPWLAGAIGEAAVTAGQTAEQIRQQTGGLTGAQAALATSAGLVTGAIGAVGGRVADALGIGDIDTLVMAGVRSIPARRNLMSALILGGFKEMVLEEMPQGAQERVHQNIATGRPPLEGVGEDAVLGGLVGFFMGAGGAGIQHVGGPKTTKTERELAASAREMDRYIGRTGAVRPPPGPPTAPPGAVPPPIFGPPQPMPPPPGAPPGAPPMPPPAAPGAPMPPPGAPTGPPPPEPATPEGVDAAIRARAIAVLVRRGGNPDELAGLSTEELMQLVRAANEPRGAPPEPGAPPPTEPPGPPPGAPPAPEPPVAPPPPEPEPEPTPAPAPEPEPEPKPPPTPEAETNALGRQRQLFRELQQAREDAEMWEGEEGVQAQFARQRLQEAEQAYEGGYTRWQDEFNVDGAALRARVEGPDPREPHLIPFNEFQYDPRATRAPKGSIYTLTPEQLAKGETLGGRTQQELENMLRVLGVARTGTKPEQIARIKTTVAARTEVAKETVASLRARTKPELLALLERLGGGRPTYLNKFALAATILNKRRNARRVGRQGLAEARHRGFIRRALDAGQEVPEEVLRRYPDLRGQPEPEPPGLTAGEHPDDVRAALIARGYDESAIRHMTTEQALTAIAAQTVEERPPAEPPKDISEMTDEELDALAQQMEAEEAGRATETGEQPVGHKPEHTGDAEGRAPEEGVGGGGPGERPTTPEGVAPTEAPEGGPEVTGPRLVVVDTSTGLARDVDSAETELGRKDALVELDEQGKATRIVRAGDQVTPDGRAQINKGLFTLPEDFTPEEEGAEPEPTPEPEPQPVVKGTVSYNPKFHSIEVKYPRDPGEEIRGRLNAAGFTFNGQQSIWYRRIDDPARTDAVIENAKAQVQRLIEGAPEEPPAPPPRAPRPAPPPRAPRPPAPPPAPPPPAPPPAAPPAAPDPFANLRNDPALQGLLDELKKQGGGGPQFSRALGFDLVAPHLTDEEVEGMKADFSQRILDLFKSLPPDADYMTVAQAWQGARDWYVNAADAFERLFGADDAPRFAALLASLSPQVEVDTNLHNAVKVWTAWNDAGRPNTEKAITRIIHRSVTGDPLPAWVDNSIRALTAADPTTITLSGPKVHSFYKNLLRHWHEVTNDTWMAQFAGVMNTVLKGTGKKMPGKSAGYLALTAKIRRVAQRLTLATGRVWTPAEVQATIWSWAKTISDLADAEKLTVEEVVRRGLVTDEAVRSAPNFRSLLTSHADVRTILEDAGYGPELAAIDAEAEPARGDTEAAQEGGRPADRAGAEARRPGDRPTPQEIRAARRLDRTQGRVKPEAAFALVPPKQPPPSDTRYEELLGKLGGRAPDLSEAYLGMPRVMLPGVGRVAIYDAGERLTIDERVAMFENSGVRRLTGTVHSLVDGIGRELGFRDAVTDIGVVLDQKLYGVWWPNDRTNQAAVLINLYEALSRGTVLTTGGVEQPARTPEEVAAHIYETIVHELVHASGVRGHEDDFNVALEEALDRLDASGTAARALQQLTEAYGTPGGALHSDITQAVATYSASRRRPSTAPSALGIEGGYEPRPADEQGGPAGAAGGAGPGGGGTTPVAITAPRIVAALKILRALKQRGITDWPNTVRAFQAIYPGNPREMDRVLENAYEKFTGQKVSVAAVLDQPQTGPQEAEGGTEGGTVPTGEGAPAGPDGRGGAGTDRPGGPAGVGTGVQGGPQLGPGEGAHEGGTVSPEGGAGVDPEIESGGSEPALAPRYYRITDADAIGTGGEREKVANNFAAITTLKLIESERRQASRDEQSVLVKYVGWGGLKRIFEPWKNEDATNTRKDNLYWRKQNEELRKLLTPAEFQRAQASVLNAHYTSPEVIRAMWEGVRRLGVRSGSALEPSAGIGHFAGLAPDDMRELAWAMVEKDDLTARIATHLYPGAYVQSTGFEDAKLPRDHFTVAISNIPFGDIAVYDKLMPPHVRAQIHNYFFGKALDMVQPGGLVAFITTHGTLDSIENRGVRQYLADRADFLGAMRLPHTAFEKNAGTSVVTDIIYLRKRVRGAPSDHAAPWIETKPVALETGKPVGGVYTLSHNVNEYFHDHPEMVLGVQTATGQMYQGNEYNVEPTGWTRENQKPPVPDLGAQIQAANEHLPSGAIDIVAANESLDTFQETQPPPGTRPFEFVVQGNTLLQVFEGKLHPVPLDTPAQRNAAERIKGMVPIRAATLLVYDLFAQDAPAADIKAAQATLTRLYDAFVDKHGYLSKKENVLAFREDPDAPILLSLESYDEELDTAEKTEIFTQETSDEVRRSLTAETPMEALHISLAETGRIDLGRVGGLLNITADEAATKLEGEGLIVYTPHGWDLASRYLSGNVRQKLVEAEAALALNARYQHAVDRLRSVVPEDIPSHKINARLGAGWVPAAMIREFVNSLAGQDTSRSWGIQWLETDGHWVVTGPDRAYTNVNYALPSFSFKQMLEAALNDRNPTIKVESPRGSGQYRVDPVQTALARQRKENLHLAFATWLFNQDPARREWAVRHYNDRFNATVDIKVDGSYLEFKGMSPFWRKKIQGHQRDGVARILQFGNTLLAHTVGAGKTLTMIAAGMEMRRLGTARKPLYVVPNHLVEQWASDFIRHYPKAKILVARPDDFNAENRKRFTARIAAGSYDAVIMPQSSFSRVSISTEAEAAFHAEQLAEVEQEIIEEWRRLNMDPNGPQQAPPSVRRLEAIKQGVENTLRDLANRPKDEVLTFEQLGVDALFSDESHMFKNLWFHTRMKAVGIPTGKKTARALDMYLKVRHINRVSNYRNVVFASGTPVANTMAEIYTVQRMLQENVLEQMGLKHFDAWLRQFGLLRMVSGVSPDGTGFASRRTLQKFQNLAQLSGIFRQFADVKLIDDLPDLKAARPKLKDGAIEIVSVPASQTQLDYLDVLKHRADHLDPKRPDLDNMAKINMDGRVAMLDIRMLDRRFPADENNKIDKVAENISTIWRESKADKGTQIVFLDLGTPGIEKRAEKPKKKLNPMTGVKEKVPPTEEELNRGIDMYEELKRRLIKQGIPEHEIYFMQDVKEGPKDEKAERQRMVARRVRRGQIRVLIGSTEAMATGMNVQDKLVALHNVDPPLKPSDLEQRNGRILRRGNKLYEKDEKNFRIRILNYVTAGQDLRFGFDSYLWQIVERKADILRAFYAGDVKAFEKLTELDLSQTMLNAGQIKAAATGNPLAEELNNARLEVERLQLLELGWREERREASWGIDKLRQSIPAQRAEVERYARTAKAVTPHTEGEPLHAEVRGEEVETHKEIGTQIINAAMEATTPTEYTPALWQTWSDPVVIGTFRGLVMRLEGNNTNRPHVTLRHPEDIPRKFQATTTSTTGGFRAVVVPLLTAAKDPKAPGGLEWRDPVGMLQVINRGVEELGKPGFLEQELEKNLKKIKDYEEMLNRPFAQAEELREAQETVERLEYALGLRQPGQPPPPPPPIETGNGLDEDEEEGADDVVLVWGQPAQDPSQPSQQPTEPRTRRPGPPNRGPAPPTGPPADLPPPPASTPPPAGGPPTGGPPSGGPPPHITPPPPPGGGGGPQAPAMGPTARTMLGNIKLFKVAPPEMLQFVKDLFGDVRVARKFRQEGKRGEFRPEGTGMIRVAAFLFNVKNQADLARTLAHEIGHFLDWLPHQTLARGNLLGRLFSLRNFVRGTFTAPDGTTVKDADVRNELIKLSKDWRPWDRTTSPQWFIKYRDSAVELYADAISALFNDPDLLEREAPTFYKNFFLAIHDKPEAWDAYSKLMQELMGTPEEVSGLRLKRVRAMFHTGEQAELDLDIARRNAKYYADNKLWARLQMAGVEKHRPFNRRVRELKKQGITINPDDDPRYWLQEWNYLGGQLKAFTQQKWQYMYENLKKKEIDWKTFGAALYYKRVLEGDRKDLANPKLPTAITAQQDYDALVSHLTADQKRELDDALDYFQRTVAEVAQQAYEAGLYSRKAYEKMLENPAYATYRVIEHIDRDINFKIYSQHGTLKDIQNPADATMLKTLATLRAIERQKMLGKAFDFLDKRYPSDIEQAKEKGFGVGKHVLDPPPGMGKKLVIYYENGQARGKYVNEHIANSLNNQTIGHNRATVEILAWVNGNFFRPLFITFNLAFQSRNIFRDLFRFWKNIPGMTFGRAVKRYWQAVPMARVRAFGLKDKPTAAQLQAAMDLYEAEKAKIFSITMNTLLENQLTETESPIDWAKRKLRGQPPPVRPPVRPDEDYVVEKTFASLGIGDYGKPPTRSARRKIRDWFGAWSDFWETLPKAAAVLEYRGAGRIADIPPDVRSHIRRRIGSPDFLSGGTEKPFYNELFLFSNAIVQGWRADMEMALVGGEAPDVGRRGKAFFVIPLGQRAEWWWKTARAAIFPKLLQFAALYGASILAAGADDDEEPEESGRMEVLRKLAEVFGNISEYDLTNYISLPLYLNEKGQTWYARIPQDDTGRLVGGIVWKVLNNAYRAKMGPDSGRQAAGEFMTDIGTVVMNVLDYTVGQMPGLAPFLKVGYHGVEFIAGHNIEDSYRQRYLFTEQEMRARDPIARIPKFIGYEVGEVGGNILWRGITDVSSQDFLGKVQEFTEKPLLQQFTEFPLLIGPLVSNWVKVSDYGKIERARRVQEEQEAPAARAQIQETTAVRDAVTGVTRLPPPQRQREITRRALEIANDIYGDREPSERRAQQLDIEKRISMGLVARNADWLTESIMSRRLTNNQKIATVLDAQRSMSDETFRNWVTQARRQNVLSDDVYDAIIKARPSARPAAAR